ncbi:MAG: nitrate reductase molybdenum cofactor assembly chaperone [Pseudomonadota bacterium]
MLILKVFSALLCYPQPEVLSVLDEMETMVEQEALLDEPRRNGIRLLIQSLRETDLIELQERYVALFDRSRKRSLHLFEHVHGESRDRGQAMVDLLQLYQSRGMMLSAKELPDYLPLFLEFLSQCPREEALELLSNAADIIQALGVRLARCDSPYRAVFDALALLAGESLDYETPAATEEDERDELAAMDAAWEAEAVSFMASTSSCQTGSPEVKPVSLMPRRARQK